METESLRAICRRWLALEQLPGLAVALVESERIRWEAAFGFAQLELEVPLTPQSPCEIASITKLLTAELVLRAWADGLIQLETTLAEAFAERPFPGGLPPAWGPIRVADLLRHRSGIRNYTAVEAYWRHTREDLPPEHILALVRELPLDFTPGSRYAYDNTGFYLLGLLLEAIHGQTYAELLQQQIFAPLQMQARIQDYAVLVPGRVAGYVRQGERIVNKPYYSPTGTYSAGGVLASARDLARWAAALYAPQRRRWRERMWMPDPSPAGNERAEGFCLGLGWFRLENDGRPFWGHNGGICGFVSALVHLPDTRRTAIVLCNGDWLKEPHRLGLELLAAWT